MKPLLSVLVPAFNEVRTIERCLERVEAVELDKEIIVVDDGSTDGTRALLTRLAEARDPSRFTVIEQARNLGKGAALRTAIARARGEICLVQDADLEYDPGDYPRLVAPILSGETSVVYGSRRLEPANHYPLDLYLVGSMALTALANALYGCRLTDEPTCYKVFRTELLQSLPLQCEGFEFCPEVTARVRRRGERIVEVPVHYEKRSVAEGKKIRWHDALVGAWTLVRCRMDRPR